MQAMAIKTYLPALAQVSQTVRLALAELLVPVLRELSVKQNSRFRANMSALFSAVSRVVIFDWALFVTLTMHLDEAFRLGTQASGRKKIGQNQKRVLVSACRPSSARLATGESLHARHRAAFPRTAGSFLGRV